MEEDLHGKYLNFMTFSKKFPIIFIVDQPINNRDFNRFRIKDFIDNGYNTKVLDLSLSNNKNSNCKSDLLLRYNKIIYSISNKNEILNFLNKINKNSIVISLSSVNSNTFFIYKTLSNYKIKFGFLSFGTNPDFYQFISNNFLRNFLRNLKNEFIFFFTKVYSSFYIVGSKADIDRSKHHILFNNKSEYIFYHNLDYDLFLEEKLKNNKIIKDKYAVFLDEANTNHPDNEKYFGTKSGPVGDNYHLELNSFFKKIENQFNLSVVIAGHPRNNFHSIENPFNPRKFIKNQTISLIKNSEFVITHSSTSANMAVIYKKPIVFISSKYYFKKYKTSILKFSGQLEKNVIDISNDNYDLSNVYKVKRKRYNLYFKNFIKYNSDDNKSLIKLVEEYVTK
jgi:hypothetical protein